MEPEGCAEAVYTENGVIKAVGDLKKLREIAGRDYNSVDLQGSALLPAFIDSHSHIAAYASTLMLADLNGVSSLGEIADRLRAFKQSAGIGDGEWLVGFGYDNNDLEGGGRLDKLFLDGIGIDNPVIIAHKSGHMGVVNSKALELFGIDSETRPPEGGKIGRLENGEPSGYLEEAAFIQASGSVFAPDREKSAAAMARAEAVYNGYGIATIQDGLTGPRELEMLKQSRLNTDVVCYVDIAKHRELIDENRELLGGYKDHLRIGGIKLILDGSPQGRTAWLTEPYENSEDGYSGYPSCTDEVVEGYFRYALENSLQILAHANGDAAAEQFIRCYDKAFKAVRVSDARPVMIHAQLLRRDLLPRVRELGIIPSFFTAHSYYWGDTHIKNLGSRAEHISPAKSAGDLGIIYTFHQDTPVIAPDMLETVRCAALRRTKAGRVIGGEERVGVLEALRAVTINAAYQYFEEDSKGSIAIGKKAEFVVLSQNPLKVPLEKIADIKVLKLIK